MNESSDTLLQAVSELARLAGAKALEHYRPGISFETKGDGSPVTVADRAAEKVAREWLARKFPGDGIVGEEFGEENTASRRRWIIDPIDGTKSFVRHVPLWGTLIAVEENGAVLAGAAFFPVLSEIIVAANGSGCWYNATRCSVSSIDALSQATILTTDARFNRNPHRRQAWESLSDRAALSRTWGDCYGYLLVASGRADAMFDNSARAWDVACFLPIIEEAGGVFTDFTNHRTHLGGDAIATNSALAKDVRAIMCDPGGGKNA